MGVALIACGVSCNGTPEGCDAPLPIQVPGMAESHAWTVDGHAIIEADVSGHRARVLLDTGFPFSALGPELARALTQEGLPFHVRAGTFEAGPLPLRVLSSRLGVDAVLGADVLAYLPLRHDARARTTTFFDGSGAPGPLVPLQRLGGADRCEPSAFIVAAHLEGRPVRLLLDTGAEATFLRSGIIDLDDGRATLTALPVHSGFAGLFSATATRVRSLRPGSEPSVENAIALTAPEVDAELDRLSQLYGGARLDGFLGWSHLRELEFTFSANPPALALVRFDTQTHWTREFMGIGILRAPSAEPAGIRVQGFLSTSPAREAGLQEGDVIVSIDGVPAAPAGPIPPPMHGDALTIEVVRSGSESPLTFSVRYADLLPDPPP